MAARYALVQFCYHNSSTGVDEVVLQGSTRDSVTDQAFTESPASYWSTTALVSGTQIDPKLAAHLVNHPRGTVS